MKGFKVKEKLKKSLIVTIVAIMIAFMMPVKAKADILNDFISLLLRIPDGVMHVIDKYIGGSKEFTSEELEFFGGWDEGGRIYNFIVTPYDIFSSGTYEEKNGTYYTKLGLLDVNFFADRPIESETIVSSEILAPIIGNVYKALRNLAMVLMLLVLLYIGIKIMISSVAAQQAKYKQLLVDWLVGFALLFVMHYIMSGIVYLNSMVVKMLSNGEGDSYYVAFAELEDTATADVNLQFGWPPIEIVSEHSTDSEWYDVVLNVSYYNFYEDKTPPNMYTNFKENRLVVRNSVNENGTFSNVGSNNDNYIDQSNGRIDLESVPRGAQDDGAWFGLIPPLSGGYKGYIGADATKWGDNGVIYLSASIINPGSNNEQYENKAIARLNAMSYVRTISSFGSEDNDSVILYDNGGKTQVDEDLIVVMGFSILYLCLVIETIMFTFTYIKRVLQMAFLTMVAPIVAIMYPVDKIGDGKAQAFNTWFKDYLFNILIQPMHLLLYTIFIVAATQLVSRNIIYALAIYGFMIPSEKYFKKLLGFEKASTGGGGPLGGAIGRGLAMDGLGRLAGIGPAARGGSGGKDGKKSRKMKLPKNKPATGGGDPSSSGSPVKENATKITPANPNENGTGGAGTRDRKGTKGDPRAGGGSATSGRAKGFFPALGRSAGRRVIRGVTGGKYSSVSDAGSAGRIIGTAAGRGFKFLGKTGGNLATRGAGAILMGAVGSVAGAATAMATGDIGSLWKGAAVGVAAGNKMANNAWDRSEAFFSDFAEDVKADRAANDEEYNAKLRKEEARKAYQDEFEQIPEGAEKDSYREARDEYSPYIDLNGDMDAIKALTEINKSTDELDSGDRELAQKIDMYYEAKSWGDLKERKRADDYREYMAESLYGEGKTYTSIRPEERERIEKRLKAVLKAQGKLK